MSRVILKYDDLTEKSVDAFFRVKQLLERNNIRGAFGLIGSSLELPSADYIDRIEVFKKKGIEIWNHGYEKAHSEHEFCGSNYEEQKESIGKTQSLMKKWLGESATTFGSPHNNSTELTISVLRDNFPEIRNYLFMVDAQRRTDTHQIILRCNYEIKTGVPDYPFFISEYSRMKECPYMMLQGHPGFWNKEGFEIHQKIIEFLLDDNCSFILPKEFDNISFEETSSDYEEKVCEDFLNFINGYENVVFYGAGEIARELYKYMNDLARKPVAFAISDGQPIIESEVCGVRVLPFSQVKEDYDKRNTCIVPALLKIIHPVVLPGIRESGFSCWSLINTREYENFVDIVRYKVGG